MSPQTTTPTLHEIHADDVREHTPLPHDVSTQAIPVVIPEGAAPVVTVHGPVDGRQAEILTDEALAFLGRLHRLAEDRRRRLLEEREYTRRRITDGWNPHYLRSTRRVREDDSWRVAPLAPGLQDRRVEITGPVDRKMTINALNSGASGWLADFEDSSTPSWDRSTTPCTATTSTSTAAPGGPAGECHAASRRWPGHGDRGFRPFRGHALPLPGR